MSTLGPGRRNTLEWKTVKSLFAFYIFFVWENLLQQFSFELWNYFLSENLSLFSEKYFWIYLDLWSQHQHCHFFWLFFWELEKSKQTNRQTKVEWSFTNIQLRLALMFRCSMCERFVCLLRASATIRHRCVSLLSLIDFHALLTNGSVKCFLIFASWRKCLQSLL